VVLLIFVFDLIVMMLRRYFSGAGTGTMLRSPFMSGNAKRGRAVGK
jgi:hypothetical protein